MSSDPAVAEKQTLTKQEKAKRFRDESDRLLSPEETGKVKLALAIFLRNKVKAHTGGLTLACASWML